MAPPPPASATATARRANAAPQPRPSTRRPPLRVFEPEPRRAVRRGPSRRAHVWLSVALVVGSLLVVVVGDALVAQGQVRLSDVQRRIAVAEAVQKSMQSDVAQLAAPDRVVAQGIALGLTAPSQVIDLPQVPLGVPLPAPQTAPATGARAAAARTSAPAATPAASTPAASAAAAGPPAATAKPSTGASATSPSMGALTR